MELMGVQLSGMLFAFQPELVYLKKTKIILSPEMYTTRSFLSRPPCINHTAEVVSTFLYHFLSLFTGLLPALFVET